MRSFIHHLVIIFLCVGLSSCKKTIEETIPNNTPPPDHTIANSVYENYVNKVYITVLGRKPSDTEFEQGKNILYKNYLSSDNRKEFVNGVLAKPGYYERNYTIIRNDFLNSLDTAEITTQKLIFSFFLTDTTYKPLWAALNYEIRRLDSLQKIPALFSATGINIIDVHQRAVNNYFYDQLNMGTENFVIACFQHFLFRYPTVAELAGGKTMVDGSSSALFLQSGKSKDDFIRIFFSSDNYYEGQVHDLFRKYVFRDPSSEEMSALSAAYKKSKDYKSLQCSVLILDEYVGIK